MLGDVGIAFRFTGANRAISLMQRLKREYGALSSQVNTGAKRIGSSFTGMGGVITAVTVGAIASIGALTAAAVAIPYRLAQSRAELTNMQANLRSLGKDDAAIASFEEAAERFSAKIAGVTKAAYTKASYDVVSAFSALSTDEQTQIADMALITGKATKMSAEHATALFGSIWGAAGDEIKKQGAVPFIEKWSGAVYGAVKELKTTGEELQSAAKNSLSMLMEAGWKPEEMTAFWGQLITSGLSGEAAGTALKQMAVKEREGFGKLLAKGSGKWTDTEWLQGDAKRVAEARNKGLTAGYSEIGSKLFRTDPTKWLDRMGGAYDKLKASGEDYKKLLGQLFGEESINAMVQFFEKRGQMRDTINTIARGSYGDVRKMVEEEMSKGIGPATKLLGQLWENLTQTMGRTSEGFVIDGFKWLGDKLLKANALWKALFTDAHPIDAMRALDAAGGESLILLWDRLKGLKSNLPALFDGIREGFGAAFGGIDGHSTKISALIDKLGTADPDAWRQIGDEFGRMAGTRLTGFLKQLQDFYDLAKNIWETVGPMAKAWESIAGNEMKPSAAGGNVMQAWKEGSLRPLVEDDRRLMNKWFGWGEPKDDGPAFPKWTGPRAPERPGMASRIHAGPMVTMRRDMEAQLQATMRPGAPTAEAPRVTNDISVYLDSAQIAAKVEQRQQSEKARHRQGAGDSFQDWGN